MKKGTTLTMLDFNKKSVVELNNKSLLAVFGGSNETIYDVDTNIDPISTKGDPYLRTQTLLEQ